MAKRRKTRKVRPTRRTRRYHKAARPWTRDEVAFLRKYYRNHETSWCARQLGRTVYSVRYKASDLHIRKGNPSTWKNPGKKVVFVSKTKSRKPSRSRTRKNVRWARTRRNNRRTRW